MLNLNDKNIRQALLTRLNIQFVKPKAIIEELRVHNGNAIADIVALYNEAHCYEIKGETDKIERILSQGSFYNSSFMKITLVTTENHLDKALKISPKYWGILVTSIYNEKIIFKHVRGAKCNPEFNKSMAVLTLWKSEMLNFFDDKNIYKYKPRGFLAQLISKNQKKTELSKKISTVLLERHLNFTYNNRPSFNI